MDNMLNPSYESSLEVFDLPQFRLAELESLLHEELATRKKPLFW